MLLVEVGVRVVKFLVKDGDETFSSTGENVLGRRQALLPISFNCFDKDRIVRSDSFHCWNDTSCLTL